MSSSPMVLEQSGKYMVIAVVSWKTVLFMKV